MTNTNRLQAGKAFFLVFFLLAGYFSFAQVRADFTIDQSGGCAPLLLSFTNRTTGASATAKYEWDLGNGNSSVLENPAATYNDAKTYTVTLKVTDGTQTSSKTATVTVYKTPTVDFTTASPKVCIPNAAGFNATVTAGDGSVSSYFWDFGDGTSQQGYGSGISHNYSYEQKPTVSLTVTNSFGCVATKVRQEAVTILPVLTAAFTPSKTLFCDKDEEVSFTNTSNGGGGSALSYTWNFGDAAASTQPSPKHVYGKKGLFTINLTVKNDDGCTATAQAGINMAYFNTDFSVSMLCRQVAFSGSGYYYPTNSVWYFGDATTGNSINAASHIYASGGSYDVKLVNTYNGVCKDSATKTIKVQDNVSYNSDFTVPAVFCRGVNYGFSPSSSVTPNARLWEFGDGTTDTYSAYPVHLYYVAGNYTIKLTNTFGTCKEVISKNIIVHELPAAKGFLAEFNSLCGAPVTVQFKDTTSDAVKWDWQLAFLNNGSYAKSTAQNPTYTYTSDGSYYISLTVTNAAGCVNNTSRYISITRPSVNINSLSTVFPGGIANCGNVIKKFAATISSGDVIKTYNWTFSDGGTSTDAQPEHTFTISGTVMLTYTTENGCTGTTSLPISVSQRIKADFTYSLPACNTAPTVNFINQTSYYTGMVWDFGDNQAGYGFQNSHTYPDTGRYTVKLIAYNSGCSDTVVKEVYTNVLAASVTITKALQDCANRGVVTFDQKSVRASGGQWDFGDGTTMPYDSSNHNVKHIYTKTGAYTVILTSYFGNCTVTALSQFKVLLKQAPVLNLDKKEICSNETINATITSLEPNPYQPVGYSYYFPTRFEYDNGTSFNAGINYNDWYYNSYKLTFSNLNKGNIKVRVILQASGSGCYDTTAFVPVKVNGPQAAFKVTPNTLCYKSAVSFEDASTVLTNTPITKWAWDFGDGSTATSDKGTTVPHTYVNPGNYYPTLNVTDASGCTSYSSYASVMVNAKGPKAAFSPYVGIPGISLPDVPLNSSITFYNNTTANSSTVTYFWDYGDGSTGTAFTGSHTYTKAGKYTVVLAAADPSVACSDVAIYIINVKPFNTAFSMATSYIGSGKCPPALVRFTNTSAGATKVVWDFGDGTSAEGAGYFSPTHIYEKSGKYKITLYTYGYNGLAGTFYDSITLTKPQTSLTADALQGCTAQTVTFRTVSKDAVSYTWDFGDGTVQQLPAASSVHQYRQAGVYTASVIARDANNCGTIESMKEKIVIDSLAIAIKGIPSYLCSGETITFNPDVYSIAEKTGKALIYEWDFGTGDPAHVSTQKSPSFTYPAPGTYTVTFRARSPYGCSKTTTATVTINEIVKGSVTAPALVCKGVPVSFTGTVPAGKTVSWSWNFGNGGTSTIQTPPAQVYATPGNYKVQLIVNNNGCFDTSVHNLTVAPEPTVSLSPKNAVVCLGNTIQLTAGGGATYSWSPAAGLDNSTAGNPVATPAASVNYTVTVTNSFGCSSKDSVKIFVAKPITLTLTPDLSVCSGKSVQLSAAGASSYQWINTTAGLSSTAIASPTASPAATTVYTVVGYDAYNCFTATKDVTVTVRPLPVVDAGADAEVLAATEYQLQPTGSADIVSWLWSPPDYLSCTSCQSPVSKPRNFMDYKVTVKTAYGCEASDSVKINLTCSGSYVFIPNSFTPNRDGRNDVFYIKGKGIGIIRYLKIYNRWGEVVFEKQNFPIEDKSMGWNGLYKGQPVPAGAYIYLAEMACPGGEPFVKKGTVTVVY